MPLCLRGTPQVWLRVFVKWCEKATGFTFRNLLYVFSPCFKPPRCQGRSRPTTVAAQSAQPLLEARWPLPACEWTAFQLAPKSLLPEPVLGVLEKLDFNSPVSQQPHTKDHESLAETRDLNNMQCQAGYAG